MSDSFFLTSSSEQESSGELIPVVGIGSSRFRYYKTRLYGVLHFVKTPAPEYVGDLVTTEALKKEFSLGYSLDHPTLVRYLRFENDTIYEQYIEGKTLREMLDTDDPRLEDKEFVSQICRQLLEGVDYLHNYDIFHLDLKPENIMIADRGNQVKILDLGASVNSMFDSTPGGSADYSAPEQLVGKPDETTDIYQIGKIVEELVAGKKWAGRWKKFIRKAIAYSPQNRFQTPAIAINHIPGKTNNAYNIPLLITASTLLLALIVFFGLRFSMNPEKNLLQPETINTATPQPLPEVTKETPREEVSASPETDVSSKPASPQPVQPDPAAVERKISKLIVNKLKELYAPVVYPLYNKMMEDPVSIDRYYKEFSKNYGDAYYDLQAYGEELTTRYPDYTDFIREKVKTVYETETSWMLTKLFP